MARCSLQVVKRHSCSSAELYNPPPRNVGDHRQPINGAPVSHGDFAAQRHGPGRRWFDSSFGSFQRGDCTIRPTGRGLIQASLNIRAQGFIRRPCCPMARCWSRGVIAVVRSLRARNCTIRRTGRGLLRATSTPHARVTRRRCCPMARSWSQEEVIAVQCSCQRGTVRPGQRDVDCHGQLNTARYYHTATLLPNGKVIVAGGGVFGGVLASAELYDPGQRDLDCDGQPQHRPRFAHGDLAAQRQGPRVRGF